MAPASILSDQTVSGVYLTSDVCLRHARQFNYLCINEPLNYTPSSRTSIILGICLLFAAVAAHPTTPQDVHARRYVNMNSLVCARAGSASMITNNRSSAYTQRALSLSCMTPSTNQQRPEVFSCTPTQMSRSHTVRMQNSSSDHGSSEHSDSPGSSESRRCSHGGEKALFSTSSLLERVGEPSALGMSLSLAIAGAWLCLPPEAQAMTITPEPSNALSLPTWAIHVSSVLEWVIATKVSGALPGLLGLSHSACLSFRRDAHTLSHSVSFSAPH